MTRVHEYSLFVKNLHARIPFRYGIATLTAVPHVFARLLVESNGVRAYGYAADSLPPKWFRKDPTQPYDDEVDEMIACITRACDHVVAHGPENSAFGLWPDTFDEQRGWAKEHDLPALLAGFGVSFVERALIDGVCRATSTPLSDALRTNVFGVDLAAIHLELAGSSPAHVLERRPRNQLSVRHTVGLGDPITNEGDKDSGDDPHDGLPYSLVENIREYGLRFFKVKIGADHEQSVGRLDEHISRGI